MNSAIGKVADFDFLTGTWDVAHRRLRQRGVGSDDWDEFRGVSVCEPRLGGMANIEQIDVPERGFSGLTLRLFDLAQSTWSIWWINSNTGRLEPPVTGGFSGNVGTFIGPDTDGDQAVTVKFTWTVVDEDHARWEQAFSPDDVVWETNWIMEFTRT